MTHMPPCAKNESLLSISDFVINNISLSRGKFNAQYKPATPVPTMTISAVFFMISPNNVDFFLLDILYTANE